MTDSSPEPAASGSWRQNAVKQAEQIIAEGVNEFVRWIESREAVPTIRALRDQAERNRRHELEKAMRQLAKGQDPQKVLEAFSKGLTNKLLHGPTQALNRAHGSEREEFIDVVQRLYHLHPDD